MADYITKEDIIKRIGAEELRQLTDTDVDGNIDDDRVAQAINYAKGIFDAYVPSSYVKPIAEATPLVNSLNFDLAYYDFWKTKGEFDEGKWRVAKAAHDDAIRFLQAVAKGTAMLDIPVVGPPTSDAATGSEMIVVEFDVSNPFDYPLCRDPSRF